MSWKWSIRPSPSTGGVKPIDETHPHLITNLLLLPLAALYAVDDPPKKDFSDLIALADKNQDGKVTREEATKAQWQNLERMDTDGDGAVTLSEAANFRQRGTRPAGVPMSYEVRNFTGKDEQTLSFGWLRPDKREQDKRYPLVLSLHGADSSSYAAEKLAVARMRERYPCFVMAPGTSKKEAFWMNTDVLERRTETEKLPIVIEALRSLLPVEPIDLSRIYVTGQSMGGAGTWGAIATCPELFAAAVPIAGAWNPNQAANMTRVPV